MNNVSSQINIFWSKNWARKMATLNTKHFRMLPETTSELLLYCTVFKVKVSEINNNVNFIIVFSDIA